MFRTLMGLTRPDTSHPRHGRPSRMAEEC
nr:hypothetical protein [Sulfobacillus harzensis]